MIAVGIVKQAQHNVHRSSERAAGMNPAHINENVSSH